MGRLKPSFSFDQYYVTYPKLRSCTASLVLYHFAEILLFEPIPISWVFFVLADAVLASGIALPLYHTK